MVLQNFVNKLFGKKNSPPPLPSPSNHENLTTLGRAVLDIVEIKIQQNDYVVNFLSELALNLLSGDVETIQRGVGQVYECSRRMGTTEPSQEVLDHFESLKTAEENDDIVIGLISELCQALLSFEYFDNFTERLSMYSPLPFKIVYKDAKKLKIAKKHFLDLDSAIQTHAYQNNFGASDHQTFVEKIHDAQCFNDLNSLLRTFDIKIRWSAVFQSFREVRQEWIDSTFNNDPDQFMKSMLGFAMYLQDKLYVDAHGIERATGVLNPSFNMEQWVKAVNAAYENPKEPPRLTEIACLAIVEKQAEGECEYDASGLTWEIQELMVKTIFEHVSSNNSERTIESISSLLKSMVINGITELNISLNPGILAIYNSLGENLPLVFPNLSSLNASQLVHPPQYYPETLTHLDISSSIIDEDVIEQVLRNPNLTSLKAQAILSIGTITIPSTSVVEMDFAHCLSLEYIHCSAICPSVQRLKLLNTAILLGDYFTYFYPNAEVNWSSRRNDNPSLKALCTTIDPHIKKLSPEDLSRFLVLYHELICNGDDGFVIALDEFVEKMGPDEELQEAVRTYHRQIEAEDINDDEEDLFRREGYLIA